MTNSITPLIQQYAVDFASNNNFLFVKGIQGDGYGTRYVDIALLNDTQPYIINSESVRVVIRGTKPDNTAIFNECEIINDNTIRVEITQQMSAVSGKGDYEISIMATEENRTLTSFPFFIMISKSSFDIGYVVSSDEFGLLISKINQIDKLNKDVIEIIEETKEVINESKTQTEECKNVSDDIKRLNESISKAEEQRAQTEIIRQKNFASAISNTNDAILNANKAADYANSVGDDLVSRLNRGEFKGDKGNDGVVFTASGQFAFQIIDDHLILFYNDNDEPPDFKIAENGHLILTIE